MRFSILIPKVKSLYNSSFFILHSISTSSGGYAATLPCFPHALRFACACSRLLHSWRMQRHKPARGLFLVSRMPCASLAHAPAFCNVVAFRVASRRAAPERRRHLVCFPPCNGKDFISSEKPIVQKKQPKGSLVQRELARSA